MMLAGLRRVCRAPGFPGLLSKVPNRLLPFAGASEPPTQDESFDAWIDFVWRQPIELAGNPYGIAERSPRRDAGAPPVTHSGEGLSSRLGRALSIYSRVLRCKSREGVNPTKRKIVTGVANDVSDTPCPLTIFRLG